MANCKSAKRAVLLSGLAVLLCTAMLIGTTFAWFTDTASTGVNKIQAGNLKVQLVDENGDDLSGKILNWKTYDNRAQAEILWEPGCSYELQPVYIKNNGTLALKYTIVISGINGSAELNEVIDWTINDTALSTPHHLAAGATSEALQIKGTMQASAGNQYQKKTIDGIAVTVYATQDAVENDSFGNTYDENADMSPDNLDTVLLNGIACDSLTSALKQATPGSVVTLRKSTAVPLKLENTEPLTVQGVTFKSESGVTIAGLQLAGTSAENKVTLKGITFDGISFTDKVLLGQSSSKNGCSQCSDISFVNCKFDMSHSAEKYKDAILHGDVSVSGTITEEKETNAYLNGLTVQNCDFTNCRYAINGGKARNVTVEGCDFTNLSEVAVSMRDVAGTVALIGNTADNTKGVLAINTVGNNYSTTNIQTTLTVKENVAANMTCANGDVFYATFDNAKASG